MKVPMAPALGRGPSVIRIRLTEGRDVRRASPPEDIPKRPPVVVELFGQQPGAIKQKQTDHGLPPRPEENGPKPERLTVEIEPCSPPILSQGDLEDLAGLRLHRPTEAEKWGKR